MTITVGSIIEGRSQDLDYQGQGVIKHEGYVIFVPRLMNNELARVRITKVKKSFCESEIIEILEKSEDRVNDPQEIDALDLYHVAPLKQIAWQERITQETLKKIADIDVDLGETICDDRYDHYRNKSVFHILNESVLKLGLYDTSKNTLIEIEEFILADEPTNEILRFISGSNFGIEKNALTHLVCRTNLEGQILVTFVSKKDTVRGLNQVVEALKLFNNVVGVTYNVNKNHKVILGKESHALYGENLIIERLNGIDLMINDRAFFQINVPVIEKAYQMIKDNIKETDVVLDAYSGIGSIGYYLYDKAKKVIMVESNKQNILLAHKIRDAHNIHNIEINYKRAEEFDKEVQIDSVVCDPPRNGLMPEFINYLLKIKPTHIYYLSCDVKTLSRDLNLLKEAYKIDSIHPIRMFYHTTSLETLVMLSLK